MAITVISIPTYLANAAIAQYLASTAIKQRKETNELLANQIRWVRLGIAAQYAVNPTDTTLISTCEYLRAIAGRYFEAAGIVQNPACVPVAITLNPASQDFVLGAPFSLSAAASGTAPVSYQWYKDAALLPGATAATYTKAVAESGDAGNYYCVATNGCGTAQTTTATMTEISGTLAYWWYGDTDPYPDLFAGTDNLSYLGSVAYAEGGAITIPFPAASKDNKYRVVRYPATDNDKTTWFNNGSNQGSIPGIAYNEVLTITASKYLSSKGDSIDGINPVIYE